MKISNLENVIKMIEWRKKNWTHNQEHIYEERLKEREERLKTFPYSVIFEMAWETDDDLRAWCWKNIGLYDCKVCNDSVWRGTGCPIILNLLETTPKNEDNEEYWEGIEDAHDAIEHGYEGNWATFAFGKTGYDYGFIEYYFKNEADKDKVLAEIPVLFPWAKI